jgi:hypothetical protein
MSESVEAKARREAREWAQKQLERRELFGVPDDVEPEDVDEWIAQRQIENSRQADEIEAEEIAQEEKEIEQEERQHEREIEQAQKAKVESEEEAIRAKKLQILKAIEESIQESKEAKVNEQVLKCANDYVYAFSFLVKGIIDHFTISIETEKTEGEGENKQVTYLREFHFYKNGREILLDGLTPILSADSKEDADKQCL